MCFCASVDSDSLHSGYLLVQPGEFLKASIRFVYTLRVNSRLAMGFAPSIP